MSAGGGKRRKKHEEEEHVNHERWMASYMDMITVMMCLFVVLYAIGQVDEVKFIQLKESLAASFGAHSTAAVVVVDGGTGVLSSDAVVPSKNDITNQSGGPVQGADKAANIELAEQEVEEFSELHERLSNELQKRGLAEDVTFTLTERGLTVGMVSADVFFGPESAELSDQARGVVDAVAGVLRTDRRDIAVEGHADVLPSNRYATNWELSADRATKVLRRLVENGGIQAHRIRAVGLGDAYPSADGGVEALAQNRRVDLVVLSDAPEDVRALIPQVANDRPAVNEGA
jgi:chemotaxis protein MotB